MSWTLYTTAEAESLLGPAELDAIRRHLRADALEEHLASVLSQVRAYCAASGGELDVEGTAPPECRHALRSLLRYSLLASIPSSALMTEARRAEREDALQFLRDVGAGRAAISRPAPPAAAGPDELAGSGPASPSICAPRRSRDRRGLDGS